MNRREAVLRISLILGGALSTELTAGLMGEVINPGGSVAVGTARQKLLAAVADTIIPATDTPGAAEAGAEQFIIRVMRDCYLQEEQELFYAELDKLDAQSRDLHGKGFAELDATPRNELVAAAAVRDKVFFGRMRMLTIAGYFTSEVGATKALEYLPVPGRFDGDMAINAGQKAWAL